MREGGYLMRSEEHGREPEQPGGDGGRAGDPARAEAGGPASVGGAGAGRAPARAEAARAEAAPAGHGHVGHGHVGHGSRAAVVLVAVLGPILLTVGYFTLPFGVHGARHRVLAWLILVGGFAALRCRTRAGIAERIGG